MGKPGCSKKKADEGGVTNMKRSNVSKREAVRQSLSQVSHIKDEKSGGYRHKHKSTILAGLRALGAPAVSL